MIRILNVEPDGYCDQARALLGQLGELDEISLCRSDLLARLSKYDVLIVRLRHEIDQEIINSGSKLKAIVTATTGLDHVDI